jgi:hypothetical protein
MVSCQCERLTVPRCRSYFVLRLSSFALWHLESCVVVAFAGPRSHNRSHASHRWGCRIRPFSREIHGMCPNGAKWWSPRRPPRKNSMFSGLFRACHSRKARLSNTCRDLAPAPCGLGSMGCRRRQLPLPRVTASGEKFLRTSSVIQRQ